MTDRYEWSAGVGRWLGVPVRVHITLLLFLVLIFSIGWHFQDREHALGTGTATAIILIVCVLLHELSHIFAVVNLGGEVHSLTLAPWGGKSSFSLPASHRDRLIVHLAGPFLNGCLFLLGVVLLSRSGYSTVSELVNPLVPRPFHLDTWENSLLEIFTWVNAQLCLINLLPCFPFDGGQIVRTLFLMVGADLSRLKIESTLLAIGQLTAAVCFVMAWLMHNQNFGPLQPTWAILLTAGIVLMFCTRFDYQRNLADALEDEDWFTDDDDLDSNSPVDYGDSSFNFLIDDGYSQWLVEKQKQRQQAGVSLADPTSEADDERRSDAILRKLHDHGIASLTEDERAVLDRVSERIRRRREQGV